MSRFLLAAPLLLVAGCATSSTPYAPVRNVSYQAMGGSPMWLLTMGDDRMVLRLRADDGRYFEVSVPRVLPRTSDGVRSWRSGDVPRIEVEARPGPCPGQGGQIFEDRVLVRLTTDVLEAGHVQPMTDERTGCGGRLLPREGTR